jgi:hypothetical protein
MKPITGFVAYPSNPVDIGPVIEDAIEGLKPFGSIIRLDSWVENDIPGRFLIDPILKSISESDLLVADITVLNFNVTFEIGYAIGQKKRVFLVKNESLIGTDSLIREIGIFDTLGFAKYHSSKQLAQALRQNVSTEPLTVDGNKVNTAAPVYLVLPRHKTDLEVRLLSRLKKARLNLRSFDAEEAGRLGAGEAIENVAASHGVVIPLLPKSRKEHDVHNFRAAFVAGVAMGLGKSALLLQQGEDPVPLDYRDLVHPFQQLDQIDDYVGLFAAQIGGLLQTFDVSVPPGRETFLERLNLGASAAENEMQELQNYYLETDEFRRVLRGEVRVVTGRKGSGKTALFVQVRNHLRSDRKKVVVDLKPEGFQLLKFREQVVNYLAEGTKEHTITAFWEYLLLLEICNKILEVDVRAHMRLNFLYEPYRALSDAYENDEFVGEGDFSERMLRLMQRIAQDFELAKGNSDNLRRLNSGEITQLLYKHNLADLKARVIEYLTWKNGVWILFDNLDKGWPPNGVQPEDVLVLRCLVDALNKLENDLRRRSIECHGTVFIRNDVFELLVAATSDRGKTPNVVLDWTDPDMLREMLRRRFLYTDNGLDPNGSFDDIWRMIAVTHIRGEETSQYIIDRSLMRPRAVIDLVRACRGHAVNLSHEKIETSDIEKGEEAFSNNALTDINFELQDILGPEVDLLYEFIEAPAVISRSQINDVLSRKVPDVRIDEVFQILLWYGFLGLIREDGEATFIYNVKYDLKHLNALIRNQDPLHAVYRINPAFWKSLETKV